MYRRLLMHAVLLGGPAVRRRRRRANRTTYQRSPARTLQGERCGSHNLRKGSTTLNDQLWRFPREGAPAPRCEAPPEPKFSTLGVLVSAGCGAEWRPDPAAGQDFSAPVG